MGNSRRRAAAALLALLLVVVGVLSEHSSTTTAAAPLGSHRNRASRRKLKKHSRGLERYLMQIRAGNLPPTMQEQSATILSSRMSFPTNLMGEYLLKADAGGSTPAAIEKYPDDHGRGLRLRPKRKWYGSGKGGKSGKGSKKSSKSKSRKGNGKYYRPRRSSSSKGKEKKSSKKGNKGKKGLKQKEKGGDGGIDSKSLGNICRGLDFGGGSHINGIGFVGDWKWANGKGKRRDLEQIERSLQYGGELCNPNAFDVASSNPDLSVFAELVYAANLEAIFLCAGKTRRKSIKSPPQNNNTWLTFNVFYCI